MILAWIKCENKNVHRSYQSYFFDASDVVETLRATSLRDPGADPDVPIGSSRKF